MRGARGKGGTDEPAPPSRTTTRVVPVVAKREGRGREAMARVRGTTRVTPRRATRAGREKSQNLSLYTSMNYPFFESCQIWIVIWKSSVPMPAGAMVV
jgi:hypothetical protein